ncbi:hypothetical protein [Desulforhopalus sp. IMCC35007]|uniref:hypothetical protein n=1 Tax=Desulforhopalus sp. IMCC35007 TaxID=2569543 RepID=UPI0010ADE69F|nr:hypothetical protein [Desulforhopalus sp. IMCC35007]TKB07781.1 hypothetical protein FCL48_15635 [Desulforhopalus sp. IMCC35007]
MTYNVCTDVAAHSSGEQSHAEIWGRIGKVTSRGGDDHRPRQQKLTAWQSNATRNQTILLQQKKGAVLKSAQDISSAPTSIFEGPILSTEKTTLLRIRTKSLSLILEPYGVKNTFLWSGYY